MVRRALWAAALAASILTVGARHAAADWSVGSNLGVSILLPSGGGDALVVAEVPAGSGLGVLLISTQPGLRFGFTDAARREEFHLDTGFAAISGSGSTLTTIQLMGSFQHAFAPQESSQPYITFGLGLDTISGGGSSANTWILGGGVGHRQFVAGGHGSLRGELRFDRIGERKERGYTVEPALNEFQMRLGFDLWPK